MRQASSLRSLALPSLALLALLACGPKETTPASAGSASPTPGATTTAPGTNPVGTEDFAPRSLEDKVAEQVELISKGDVDSLRAAAAKLEELSRENPDNAILQYNAGVAYEGLGDLLAARKAYLRATDIDPKVGDAWLNLGALAEREGDLDRALRNYESGSRFDPENSKLIVGIIGVLRKQGHYDEAISKAKVVLVRDANNVDAYNNLGLVYLDQGNADLALFVYLKALAGIPAADSNATLHCNLGRAYLAKKDKVSARKELERALELDSKMVAARLFLASDALDNRDWDKARLLLEAARDLEPENAVIYMNLGIAYRGLGRLEEAKGSYEKALTLDPENPDPYMNLALLQGDYFKSYDVALENINKYRNAGGRDAAQADAWEADFKLQKEKYEAALAREKAKKEREAKAKAREEQKARDAAQQQAPAPQPDVVPQPTPDPAPAPQPDVAPLPTPDPAPAPTPAPPDNGGQPDGTQQPDSPWGGTP